MSFIYILQHAIGNRIKIGHSASPFSRARSLPDRIDYSRSFQMLIEPSRWRSHAEKTLQFVVREFSVTPHQGDGGTEWFDARALPVVKAFIERNPEILANITLTQLQQPSDVINGLVQRLVVRYRGRLRFAF